MNKTLALTLAVVSLALPAAAHGSDGHRANACDDGSARTTNGSRDTDVRFARDMANGRGPRAQPGDFGTFVDVEAAIRHGLQSGRLTRREAAMLRAQARDVDVTKRRAWRNGRISHGEAHQIARAEEQLANNLHRQLHDGDRRFDGGPGRHDDGHGQERRDDGRRDDRDDRDEGRNSSDTRRSGTVASR